MLILNGKINYESLVEIKKRTRHNTEKVYDIFDNKSALNSGISDFKSL